MGIILNLQVIGEICENQNPNSGIGLILNPIPHLALENISVCAFEHDEKDVLNVLSERDKMKMLYIGYRTF